MSEVSNRDRVAKVEDYDTILEALQRSIVSGGVHIAGGAVRDTILGRQIKDIDIFLGDAHGEAAATLLRSKFGYVKVGQWKRYEGFSDPMVMHVAKFEKADETIPICLIGLAEELDAYDNIKRFDFGVCMAAWKGGGSQMFTADQFKQDAESRTFTLCRADNGQQFAYSMVRYEKLTADRYKNWTLSVPDQFEGLLREHDFRKRWYKEDCAHFGIEHVSYQMLRPKQR